MPLMPSNLLRLASSATEPSLSDDVLAQKVQQGDRDAYAELVTRYAEPFRQFAYRQLNHPHDAEDLTQEVFTKFWQRPYLWKPTYKARFKTWFYQVLLNACKDAQKKKKPLPLNGDWLANQPHSNDTQARVDENSHRLRVIQAVHALPNHQRDALLLCFYQGLSNQEAATILEVSLKALESLLMRGKTTLKKRLKEGHS